jgi:hypothetical protein
MLYRLDGTVITKADLRHIRERLGIISAIEAGTPCGADADDDGSFRRGRCCYCGVNRRLHRHRRYK